MARGISVVVRVSTHVRKVEGSIRAPNDPVKEYKGIKMSKILIGKRTSLSHSIVNYCRLKFYSTGPLGQSYKTFYRRNLRVFVIS